uniref:(northern house mosquito) hypothetical protein n=1 Tax=Culex pipiens TaxID=7175 RepID=A0A8D8C900_CULPI
MALSCPTRKPCRRTRVATFLANLRPFHWSLKRASPGRATPRVSTSPQSSSNGNATPPPMNFHPTGGFSLMPSKSDCSIRCPERSSFPAPIASSASKSASSSKLSTPIRRS